MPVCPRCGKCLSSDQALTYHMNKKFKCGSWKCFKCSTVLGTKLDLQMHHMHCLPKKELPYAVLLEVFENIPGILVISDDGFVERISPKTSETFEIDEGNAFNKVILKPDIKIKNLNHKLFILSRM